MVGKIKNMFREKFGQAMEIISFSPGRINLIGEHTDYNKGFVLPAAIDKGVYAAIGKRKDSFISIYSCEFKDSYAFDLNNIIPSDVSWANYILGVAAQLIKQNYPVQGFNIVIGGNVPIGAGLSSSAAVECAVIYGLNELFQLGIEKLDMVKMAQKAEHEYAGVKCGIMDQFASMFGKKNHVIRLDCRSLEYKYEPFQMDAYKVVLFDTGVKHSLASSEYNVRRKQCEMGVTMIQQHVPALKNLRDANLEMLGKYVLPHDITVYQRCKYVVEENQRLLEACIDLETKNIKAFGEKMFETHDGLSKLYEVSCTELDFLVSHVRDNPNVFGARMMGGGFGGCTINLVKNEVVDELIQTFTDVYKKAMGKNLNAYVVNIEDGSSILN